MQAHPNGENPSSRLISAVVPVLNEVDSLGELYAELSAVADAHGLSLELVFVDDGSADGSWEKIEELARTDSRVRGIRFRRNFGKAAGLGAGFNAAGGEIIVTLDADLQDDPHEIPKLLAALDGGLEAVTGWKRRRHDPWHKVWPSRIFNRMIGWLTGVRLHDHNCGLKAYRREVVSEVRLYGELHRFIPVLAHARGFRVGEVEVNHRPRRHGQSKYGARRFLRGFLDLLTVSFLTGYEQRPLHFLGSIGVLAFSLGILGAGYLAVLWCLGHRPIGDRPLLTYSFMSMVVGTHMIALGFLAELMIAQGMREETRYSVAETTGKGGPPT